MRDLRKNKLSIDSTSNTITIHYNLIFLFASIFNKEEALLGFRIRITDAIEVYNESHGIPKEEVYICKVMDISIGAFFAFLTISFPITKRVRVR